MITVTDQVGNKIILTDKPKRIISLVPSQTELLHYFGLEEETVGITKFCIHPESWFKSKVRVGGTKNLSLDKIRDLNPDLIIANKEENTQAEIEQLQKEYPVYISDINSIEDAYLMIQGIGVLTACEQKVVDLIDAIQESFEDIKRLSGKVVYLIWKDPYMVCGSSNFIHSVLERIGFENNVLEARYIEITLEEINDLDPDYIFLSTEPYPFKESDKREMEQKTNAKVQIVDGEMFSWYGSRMLQMSDYFNSNL